MHLVSIAAAEACSDSAIGAVNGARCTAGTLTASSVAAQITQVGKFRVFKRTGKQVIINGATPLLLALMSV